MTDLLDRVRFLWWRYRLNQASARLDRINQAMVVMRREQVKAAAALLEVMTEGNGIN